MCGKKRQNALLNNMFVCVGRGDRILALINTLCMGVGREDQLLALIIVMCVCVREEIKGLQQSLLVVCV